MRPRDDLEDRGSHNFWAIARLKPGVTLERARAEMHTIADRLGTHVSRDEPRLRRHGEAAPRIRGRRGSPALLSLLGAVGFILLLTCANIATLLLVARGSAAARGGHAAGARREPGTIDSADAGREPAARVRRRGRRASAVAYAGTRVLVSLAPATHPAARADLGGRAGARVHGRDRRGRRTPVRPGARGARLVGEGDARPQGRRDARDRWRRRPPRPSHARRRATRAGGRAARRRGPARPQLHAGRPGSISDSARRRC